MAQTALSPPETALPAGVRAPTAKCPPPRRVLWPAVTALISPLREPVVDPAADPNDSSQARAWRVPVTEAAARGGGGSRTQWGMEALKSGTHRGVRGTGVRQRGRDWTFCCVHQPNGCGSCNCVSRKSPRPRIPSGLRAGPCVRMCTCVTVRAVEVVNVIAGHGDGAFTEGSGEPRAPCPSAVRV